MISKCLAIAILAAAITEQSASRAIRMAVEDREFGNLIGSDKVENTDVYGADEKKIGSIKRVMIDKVSWPSERRLATKFFELLHRGTVRAPRPTGEVTLKRRPNRLGRPRPNFTWPFDCSTKPYRWLRLSPVSLTPAWL